MTNNLRELLDTVEAALYSGDNLTNPVAIKDFHEIVKGWSNKIAELMKQHEGLMIKIDGRGKRYKTGRQCSACGLYHLQEGYIVGGGIAYYCSDKCLHTVYPPEIWKEMSADQENNDQNYWTQWEENEEFWNYNPYEIIVESNASKKEKRLAKLGRNELIERVKAAEMVLFLIHMEDIGKIDAIEDMVKRYLIKVGDIKDS